MGGIPIMWRTGHSFIKTKMKEENAMLAGEMSGHIFFAEDYYNFDDAIFGACKIIKFLSHSHDSITEIIDTLPKMYSTTELKINVIESEKFIIVEKLKELLTRFGKGFNDLDGIRVKEVGGWWLLRASNTQSVLVVRIEAESIIRLREISDILIGYCKSIRLSTDEIEFAVKNLIV
jgi:phosphomannomutase